MNTAKALWATVQGSPVFMRRTNGLLTLGWTLMLPTAILTGWIYLNAFISVISIYANMTGHWSAWQAARVECKQEGATRAAVVFRMLHGWLTLGWAVMLPVAIFTGLIYDTAFISLVSIYANVAGHASTWQAARVEVRQDQQS